MPLIFPRLNEELLCELLRIHIIHISIFAEYQFNILESLLGGRGGEAVRTPCTLPLGPRLHRIYWILKLFWPNCITFYFFSYFKKNCGFSIY